MTLNERSCELKVKYLIIYNSSRIERYIAQTKPANRLPPQPYEIGIAYLVSWSSLSIVFRSQKTLNLQVFQW